MLRQLLNRDFVLAQLDDVVDDLKSSTEQARRGRRHAFAQDLDDDDIGEAISALEDARSRESQKSTGQPGFELPAAERRGQCAPHLDDLSFLSRDPIISNLQSALEEYLEEQQTDDIDVETTQGRRSGGDSVSIITDRGLKNASISPDTGDRRLFNKFSVTDIGWVSSLTAMGIRKFRKRHKFISDPAPTKVIGDNSRVLIVGDWGSGLPRAQAVADQMKKVLKEGEGRNIDQHVIHLGDVYYSGWEKEFKKRFLPYWPVDEHQKDNISSWSVNANHDMYSGGYGYYGTLLTDPRFAGHEGCSFFSIANSKWRILGMDTGWKEGGLKEPQPEWVKSQAEEAKRDGQNVVLLSHHQPFSLYEDGNDALVESLQGSIGAGLVHSWIWGHEHRCIVHGPHAGLQFSACIGHGGVPVYMTHDEEDDLPAPGIYEYRNRIKRGLESWALFGFAVLEFSGNEFEIRLIDEYGNEHYGQTVTGAAENST